MIDDPLTPWEGPHPYAVLAPAGVTPHTSRAELRDVPFVLLGRRLMAPRTQQAWEQLRTVRRRLLVDLLLYEVDLAAAVTAARRRLADESGAAASPAGTGGPNADAPGAHGPDATAVGDEAGADAPATGGPTSPNRAVPLPEPLSALLDDLLPFDR